jgi:hypothetical protein
VRNEQSRYSVTISHFAFSRRIGKTSLLNKIARMGLEDIGLVPVLTDIQGIGTEYEFVKETARKMSEALGLAVPHIGQTEPVRGVQGCSAGHEIRSKGTPDSAHAG